MLKTVYLTVLLGIAGVAGATAAEGAPIRISGSTSVANAIVLPHQAGIARTAGVEIVVTAKSSGDGVKDLACGRADIAMISADLDEIMGRMSQVMAAYNVTKNDLKTFDVGEARVEFIVNKDSPVTRLSADQIKGIYLGTLTNWRQLGAPAAVIQPVAPGPGDAMRIMLEAELLGGQKIPSTAELGDEAPQIAGIVARIPNGIGFVSSATPDFMRKGTRTVDTEDHLVQHLTLVTRGEPSGDIAKVIDAIVHLH